jgi:hypothetical protein
MPVIRFPSSLRAAQKKAHRSRLEISPHVESKGRPARGESSHLNALDGESAAKELKPDLAPADQAVLGRKLETDPRVHLEVEKQLTPRGLSDHDREYFVTRLWQMFDSTIRLIRAKSKSRSLGQATTDPQRNNVRRRSGKDCSRATGWLGETQRKEGRFNLSITAPKRTMSPATRKKVAAAQRARWAMWRKTQRA